MKNADKFEGDDSLNAIVKSVLEQSKNNNDVALIYDDLVRKDEITYCELGISIEKISALLQNFCQSNEYVGVDARSSLGMIKVLLSVINAKAIYCPLDFQNNFSQATTLCKKLKISILVFERETLTDNSRFQNWLSSDTHSIQNIDSDICLIKFNNQVESLLSKASNIEFVVQSSGSTGSAKIIKVPSKCIYPNIKDLCNKFNICSKDTVFLSSALTFDASIVQIFISLLGAAKLLIVPDNMKKQPSKLCNILFKRNKASILQATPSLMQNVGEQLLSCGKTFSETSSRVICLGAEPFPCKKSIERLAGSSSILELYNIYGISEVSSWASLHKVSLSSSKNSVSCSGGFDSLLQNVTSDIEKELTAQIFKQSVPVGDPLSDTVIELRNKEGGIVSEGLGQIWIGGKDRVCLVDDESEFVPNKMRFSGDTGLIKDGKIFYVGRTDNRIKIFGQYVNLELIESAVQGLPGVQAAVCLPITSNNSTAQSYLCLTVAVSEEVIQKQMKEKIVSELRTEFPAYCIPSQVIFLLKIPLTAHGKKDRESVRKLVNILLSNDRSQTHSSLQEDVLKLLNDGLETVHGNGAKYDCNKSLTENGGNSVLAVFIENEIRKLISHHCVKKLYLSVLYDYVLSKNFKSLMKYIGDEMNSNMIDHGKHSAITKQSICCSDLKSERESLKEDVQLSTDNHHKVMSNIKRFKRDNSQCSTINCYCSLSKGNRISLCSACSWKGETSSCFERVSNLCCCSMKKLCVRWKVNTGKCIDASALIVCCGNHPVVYIGSHSHRFLAIKTDDGQVLWDTKLGDRIESSAALSKDGHKLIVGSYDANVYVLERNNGEILWKFQTGDCVKCSAITNPENGIVYIGSHDQHLYALNIDKYEQVWRIFCGGGSCFSSPVLSKDNKELFIGTLAGNLLAIKCSTGDMKWKFTTGKPIFSSPTICQNTVVIGCVDCSVYNVNTEGIPLWKLVTNAPIFSSTLFVDYLPSGLESCIIFGSHDNNVYCASSKGSVLWKFNAQSPVYSTASCIVTSSHLQCKYSSRHFIVVCSTKGRLFVLKIENGEEIASYDLPNEIFSSPIVFDNNIVVGCRDDNVYCFNFM